MQEPSPFGPGNPVHPSLRYVFLRFLRYGFLAWGGPVAQIGLMHKELVERDAWVTEDRFRKTLALYQALPGPEANELAVYFGMIKRGRWGGLLAGLGFALPGILLVTLLAAAYRGLPTLMGDLAPALYGLRAGVVALIALALWRIGRMALTRWGYAALAVAAAAASLLVPEASFVLVLATAGALAVLAPRARAFLAPAAGGAGALALPLLLAQGATIALPVVGALAITMAKAGLLTFGGAYTVIPILHEDAVQKFGWLSEQEFVDAFALAGLVPGPYIAVGVFVGYLVQGLGGALIASVLIFAPAFALTLAGHDFFERAIHAPRLHDFLLGVTAAVVGLIFAASIPVARAAIVDVPTALIAVGCAVALHGFHARIPLVLLGAGIAGALLHGLPS